MPELISSVNTDKEAMSESAIRMTEAVMDGVADEAFAYKLGMQMLAAYGEPIRNIDLGSAYEMSVIEAREFLDGIGKAKDAARQAEVLFSHYPIISLSFNGLAQSIFYAEVSLTPMFILAAADSSSNKQRQSTYVVRNPQSGLIKIGRTSNLKTRIQALQCGSGIPLQTLAFIPSDIEQELHFKFKDFRVHGEWFDDAQGLIALYAKQCQGVA